MSLSPAAVACAQVRNGGEPRTVPYSMIDHGPAGFATNVTTVLVGVAVICADAPNRFSGIPDIDSVPPLPLRLLEDHPPADPGDRPAHILLRLRQLLVQIIQRVRQDCPSR